MARLVHTHERWKQNAKSSTTLMRMRNINQTIKKIYKSECMKFTQVNQHINSVTLQRYIEYRVRHLTLFKAYFVKCNN